ncbi:MAG: porin [Planctomycetales bacterium]|nr:porin [Planctomycetales bacterium]
MKSKFVKAGIIVAGFWCGTIAQGADQPSQPRSAADVYQSGFEQVFNEEYAGKIAPVGGTNECAAPAGTNCAPANAAGCGPAATGCNVNQACSTHGGILGKCSLDSLCGGDKCNGSEEAEAWALQSLFTDKCDKNWLDDNGLKLGGWTAISATVNFASPRDRFNGPVTWMDRSNEAMLNEQWLFLEKATKTDECNDWDIGGRVDWVYGTNARFDQAAGLEDRWITDHSFYQMAMPQFYAELAYKKLSIKVGHFFTTLGYFVVPTTGNFFNTLPYTFQYGEPFTHTGIMATYKPSDALALHACVIRGWDSFKSVGQGSPDAGFLGGVAYTWEDKSSLALSLVYSQEVAAGAADGFGNRYTQSLVYSRPMGEKFNYVLQTDYGNQDEALATGQSAQWYGINQYLFYTQSEKLAWGGEFEWFRDDDGTRVGGFLPNASTVPTRTRGLDVARSGFSGNFYQITFGPKWTVNKNMYVRPNLRCDWYYGEANVASLLPYADGSRRTQQIISTDLVITY